MRHHRRSLFGTDVGIDLGFGRRTFFVDENLFDFECVWGWFRCFGWGDSFSF